MREVAVHHYFLFVKNCASQEHLDIALPRVALFDHDPWD